jgi:hypothetical protein
MAVTTFPVVEKLASLVGTFGSAITRLPSDPYG